VPRLLPILGLPLLADGMLTLVLKLRSRFAEFRAIVKEANPGEEH
jgi:hypothetical protein